MATNGKNAKLFPAILDMIVVARADPGLHSVGPRVI